MRLGFVVASSGRGAFRFYHALAHDVAYGRLPVSACRELHARYAAEGVAPSDALARAYHLWQAVKPPDAEWVWEDASRLHALRREAFSAQFAAGQQLESHNQYEQAEQAYARALELAADDTERAIHHLPLLDEAGRVAGVALLDELVADADLPMQAVVMAGGFGSRLTPLTDAVPKPMLDVGD